MKNVPKMFVASAVAGVVVFALALGRYQEPGRAVVAGIVGAALMMGLLVILRWRP